jgi:mRNA interferase RelE/StbE
MKYSLAFLESALKEWRKLSSTTREQLRAKLNERLVYPHVASSKLYGFKDCYKIKLLAAGIRLVYRVNDAVIVVTVIAIGKRDKDHVYRLTEKRLKNH